jgi:integrase
MPDRSKYLYRQTKNGLSYLFFRFKGKLTPLPTDENSAAFRRDYDACMAKIAPQVGVRRVQRRRDALNDRVGFLPDTMGAAIDKYLDSPRFKQRPASTQYVYRQILAQLRQCLGAGKLADLDTDTVDIHTENIANERGDAVADRHLRMISLIWQTVRKHPQFKIKGKSNPTIDAEKRYSVKRQHRPWPPEVQEAFMESAPERLTLAKLLLHYSGQRGGDCIKMKWEDFDGKGISVRPEKTMGEADAVANYHQCPRPLREALLAAPHEAETILVNADGKPYTRASTLALAIKRELIRLGLVKKGGRAAYVMHGLRKNAASDVASLGFGAAGVKSVGGWRSDQEANYYAAHADKRRINAMVIEQWDAELERTGATVRRRRVK